MALQTALYSQALQFVCPITCVPVEQWRVFVHYQRLTSRDVILLPCSRLECDRDDLIAPLEVRFAYWLRVWLRGSKGPVNMVYVHSTPDQPGYTFTRKRTSNKPV